MYLGLATGHSDNAREKFMVTRIARKVSNLRMERLNKTLGIPIRLFGIVGKNEVSQALTGNDQVSEKMSPL